MINILIADDHAMVREGLKQVLELDNNIKIVGEAGDGFECLNMMDKLNPDIVLLDINMPRLDGIQVLEFVKQKEISNKIIVLTIHKEIDYLIKVLDIGCDGYVLKDSDSATLRKAVYAVYEGDGFVEPSLTQLLNSNLAKRDVTTDKARKLTKRETEILKCVANGMINREIAEKLDISERTVKNHISNIFRKIDVTDRTQAAVFAIKNKIVEIV